MPITVTLKNNKSREYNLTITADCTQFKSLITKAINNNDLDKLAEIKLQLEVIQNKSDLEKQQLEKIVTKLHAHAQLVAPITINIVAQPLATPVREAMPIIMVPSAENGETSFQELYANLMIDMARYTGNIDHLIWCSALVLNMFIHVATFTPHDGHGKAQLREFNHKSQLQYYRSQGNHVSASFFKELIKHPSDIGKCRLPFNEGFIKLIGADDFSPNFCAELKKIDQKTGCPKVGKKVDAYVMTQIAHAGARKNNLSTLLEGMNKVVEGCTNATGGRVLQKKLCSILSPTKAIIELNSNDCTARINELLTRFKNLRTTCQSIVMVDEQLSSRLLKYRTERVQAIKQRVSSEGLKHIVIESTQRDITCLMIRLYPNCTFTDDTYKEGVTNVLLSFFGALLNHHAQQKGLRIHTERRQSFGFLRPTLTDAGCLMIRLSLGLEPKSYDAIIVRSLKKFDGLLERFKFDQKAHNTVSIVFDSCKRLKDKEEGKRKPRAPDTYIRSVVRKDNLTFTTFHQAKAYIDQAAERSDSRNYLDQAMTNFLKGYVRNGITLPLTNKPHLYADHIVQIIESPIINLLQNTLTYVFNFVEKLTFLTMNDPLQSFGHVYLHSLLKLFNNCQEAQFLLTQMTRTEATEFHFQALSLTENILEYLISLDGLQKISAELQQQPVNAIAELRTSELTYAKKMLQISSEQLQLFFTDSGQQAITTALLTLSIMLHGPAADGHSYDGDIYLFGSSYYEVAEFIKDCKKDKLTLEMHSLNHAKIVFVDISQIDQLNLKHCTAMKALVIDTTHHPLFDQVALRQIINTAHERGSWVTLVESCLKHAQLGLDKYQIGKIITIAPPGLTLPLVALDLFETVSRDAIHPSAASFLSMVNAICREKQALPVAVVPLTIVPSKDKVSAQALVNRGFTLGTTNLKTAPDELEAGSSYAL